MLDIDGRSGIISDGQYLEQSGQGAEASFTFRMLTGL